MTFPDEKLIAGIRKDDYTCYNQLFTRYYSRLCVFVYRMIQNSDASEDIIQDLFIRLWTNRRKLEINENISGYLYRSSRNAALNYLRAEKSRKKTILDIPSLETISDECLIEQIEFNMALHQCIEQLPERCKEVFLKSRFENLKQQEIATQLGISIKTIKNHIWKSLRFLKSCLELKNVF